MIRINLILFCALVFPTICAENDSVTTEKPAVEASKQESEKLPKDGAIKFDPLNESAPEEILLFQELAKRSQEINAREDALKKQTLLLKAAEYSMNEKLKHFDLLKQDLLKMLDKLKEKDEKQFEDLVKIYGDMKPKRAASILNLMDMPFLKEIVKRMGKKKAALILAAMDAKKAKEVSQMLIKESQNIS